MRRAAIALKSPCFYGAQSKGWPPSCVIATIRSPLRNEYLRPFSQSRRWTQRASITKGRADVQDARDISGADAAEPVKAESFRKPGGATPSIAPNTDSLLSEQTVSNKEQRKADWAIIKEMAQYLWPKVGYEAYSPSM